VRSLERAAASSNVYPWIPRIASVSAPDERTVLVALDEPVSNYPLFLSLPRYAILPGGDPSARIGTGPFRVESVEHGEIALSAFPGHRDGRPFVDRVEFLHADNPRTRILEFMMGRYAATLLPVKDLPRFLEQEEWRNQIVTVEHGNIDYIGIRCDRPPFDRPSVRKAANQALDREGLRTLLGEEAVLQAGVDPFAECDPLEIYPFNRQKARKAIAGEGAYTNVVVMGVEESPYADAVVLEKIVADLRGAGLARLVVERAPGAAFRDAMAEGRYDLFYTTLFVDIPIAERYRRPFDGGWNPCGYAAGKANLLETPPWIFLFRRRLRLIHHPYVQGLSLHADGCIDFQGAWRE
jgi:peptide/nickel transport system substrate-binding protein